jgi:hypothetical protein
MRDRSEKMHTGGSESRAGLFRGRRTARLQFFAGIAVSLAIVVIIVSRIDFGAIRLPLSRLKLWWVPSMISVYFAGFLVRGVRARLLLSGLKTVSFSTATEGVFIGYLGNTVLPARAGELARAFFVGNRTSISRTSVLGTVIVERIFDGFAILAILGATLFFCHAAGRYQVVRQIMGVGSMLFGFLAVAVVFGARRRSWFEGLIAKLLSRLPASAAEKSKSLTGKLLDSLGPLKSSRVLIEVLLLSALTWCVEGFVFLFGLLAFGQPGYLTTAYLTMSFVNLGLILPSAPAGIGVFQAGVVLAFSVFGLSAELALIYSLLIQGVMVATIVTVGLLILNIRGMTLSKIHEEHGEQT